MERLNGRTAKYNQNQKVPFWTLLLHPVGLLIQPGHEAPNDLNQISANQRWSQWGSVGLLLCQWPKFLLRQYAARHIKIWKYALKQKKISNQISWKHVIHFLINEFILKKNCSWKIKKYIFMLNNFSKSKTHTTYV